MRGIIPFNFSFKALSTNSSFIFRAFSLAYMLAHEKIGNWTESFSPGQMMKSPNHSSFILFLYILRQYFLFNMMRNLVKLLSWYNDIYK